MFYEYKGAKASENTLIEVEAYLNQYGREATIEWLESEYGKEFAPRLWNLMLAWRKGQANRIDGNVIR